MSRLDISAVRRRQRADCRGSRAPHAHIRRETIINVAVNVVIAPLLYVAMHDRVASFPVWGRDGLFAELVTQAASVAAFGSGIPAWTTWRRARAGKLAPLGPVPPPGGILRLALLLAYVAVALVGAVGAGVLLLAGTTHVDYAAVMTIKALLGGFIAAAITPLALRRTLGAR